MKNCAVVGVNWGDEGKGRMVDLLTEKYDVVVRYQGGGNAGHTVVNEKGKFALHLLPSGILRDGVVNVLGNGVALDPENLLKEIREVTERGVRIGPENLMISDRASLLMPWHRDLDGLEEDRLADKKYGSTRQGIAAFYSDKYQKKTVLAGELFYPEALEAHLKDLLEWKNLTLTRVYGAELQTVTEIALTKLDVLSYLDQIPVCTRYRIGGEETDRFPFPALLSQAEPVIEWVDGWKCDISSVRKWEDLPKAAQDYVLMIEEAVSCPVRYVSVGPDRESIVIR